MRILVALVGTVGCFSPHIPPELANPPPIGSDAPLADSPVVDPDAAVDADLRTHFEYPATVAECINPNNPNPNTCRSVNGALQMVVDGNDSTVNNPWVAYIRFDLDAAIGGKTVVTVKLRVTATSAGKANGPNTGELWTVQPFAAADLVAAAPAQVTRQAGSQGAVSQLDVIEFPILANSVTASTRLHLGIFPLVNEGVNYWNIDGADPPLLIIDTQ